METHEVIKIFSEMTSGPISSGPTASPGTQPQTEIQEEVETTEIKPMVQEAINNVGKQLNLQPSQIPDFAKKFQNEIQQQLTELQNKAKSQPVLLSHWEV